MMNPRPLHSDTCTARGENAPPHGKETGPRGRLLHKALLGNYLLPALSHDRQIGSPVDVKPLCSSAMLLEAIMLQGVASPVS
jgi:hypothetical protein